jgi:hypothetical protein
MTWFKWQKRRWSDDGCFRIQNETSQPLQTARNPKSVKDGQNGSKTAVFGVFFDGFSGFGLKIPICDVISRCG